MKYDIPNPLEGSETTKSAEEQKSPWATKTTGLPSFGPLFYDSYF